MIHSRDASSEQYEDIINYIKYNDRRPANFSFALSIFEGLSKAHSAAAMESALLRLYGEDSDFNQALAVEWFATAYMSNINTAPYLSVWANTACRDGHQFSCQIMDSLS